MFFVLSSGRSGSKTIASTLNQFRDCVCLHHPKPELVEEATEYSYGERGRDEIVGILRESRTPTLNDKVYGEVNLQLTLVFPAIREAFPNAQFIWLLRDGRDVVASMYCRGWYDPHSPNSTDAWHRARLDGSKTGDFSAEAWQQLDRFDRCCWLWRKYNELIEQHLTPLDVSLWKKVHLETLKRSLDDLGEFLGIHSPPKVLVERRNAARHPVVAWQQWNETQRQQFEVLCGERMDDWYPTWKDANGQWQEIASESPDHTSLLRLGARRGARFAKKVRGRLLRLVGYKK